MVVQLKKKKHLAFSLYPDILPLKIHVAYSEDFNKTCKYFRKVTGEPDLGGVELSTDARCTLYQGNILIEIKPNKKRSSVEFASLIAHEAVHASWYMEKILGEFFNENAQESQAYFVQYLVLNILDRILDYDKNIKLK